MKAPLHAKTLLLSLHLLAAFFGVPPRSNADPIHDHCFVDQWTESFEDLGGFDTPDAEISVLLQVLPFIEAAPLCVYETSDLRFVDIELVFVGAETIVADSVEITAEFLPFPIAESHTIQNVEFSSQMVTTLFTPVDHLTGNAFHLFRPGDLITLTFTGLRDPGGNEITVTDANISVGGGEYYLEVPEPNNVALAMLSLMGMCCCRRKQAETGIWD